ncbi:MAG: amidohydrolase, partial [Alphaproteobacteria bacterium]|nr:amidohydrolase [Alphaproteobacteria bacterium]
MKDIVISADSHVMEPLDLWESSLSRRFGDQVPRVVKNYEGHPGTFFFAGREAFRIDDSVDAERAQREQELKDAGDNPSERLRLMDKERIAAEVLNPTKGLLIPRIPNRELRKACASVMNDWLIEHCSQDTKRLVGVALIPIEDVSWAIAELKRVVGRGMKGVMIGLYPEDGAPPYRSPVYDPFWAAVQEMDIPLTLHIVAGRVRDPGTYHGESISEAPAAFIELFNEGAPVLANEFIFGGILDRFPRLKLLLSEFDASWLPIFRYRIKRIQRFAGLQKLKRPAEQYLAENVHAAFINDPLVCAYRHDIGLDRLMWGSDFPHPPCPYPDMRQRLDAEILVDL